MRDPTSPFRPSTPASTPAPTGSLPTPSSTRPRPPTTTSIAPGSSTRTTPRRRSSRSGGPRRSPSGTPASSRAGTLPCSSGEGRSCTRLNKRTHWLCSVNNHIGLHISFSTEGQDSGTLRKVLTKPVLQPHVSICTKLFSCEISRNST